jgi:3-oxoacyl-(acyl-carrier-protein) synthase
MVGTSSGDMAAQERRYRKELNTDPAALPIRAPAFGSIADSLTQRLRIGGPRYTVSTACSAGANALLYAAWMIREGRADHALVVGAELRNDISLLGFSSMHLIASNGCRPFDADRTGIVLGEVLAVTVLGCEPPQRSGRLWRLHGGATLCDHSHPTSSSPEKIALTMQRALRDAGIDSADIRAIKTHGTGTASNDLNEALGLLRSFGPQAPPFTSIKPLLGHTLGACGVAETLAIQACLDRGLLPGTSGFRDTDPEIGIRPQTVPLSIEPGPVLLNYFGFGGNNCSLVIGPC